MTDHEKDLVASIVRNKYGDYEVFPLKVVEARHGFWVNADIWVCADELVRVQGQAVQDAGSSLQGDEVMEIFLYEVVFEVAAEDAQSGGELLENALNEMPAQEILGYEINEEVTLVRYTHQ